MTGDIILEMKDINKHFGGVQALRGVDFILKKGEVHALIGENGAGKSTLMKVLIGYHQPDIGQIIYKEKETVFRSTLDALKNGISMIFQEFNSAPFMTVAENIYLNREPMTKYKTIDYKQMQRDAAELFRSLDVDIDPAQRVCELSVAKKQLVEIVKAISYDSEIIIMDEPTSALSEKETSNLFKIIRRLKESGRSVIYISHKLEEIYAICQSATIMRDGLVTGTGDMSEFDQDKLVMLMVNRKIDEMFPKLPAKIGETILKVENLTKNGCFQDINFELHRGEILGLSGLLGAGRTEIAEAIVGFRKPDSGTIYVDGKKVEIKHPSIAFEQGIAMVPEDRKLHGAILRISIKQNIVLSKLTRILGKISLNAKKEKDLVQKFVEKMQIKIGSMDLPVNSLSGGNQQKVVMARVLFSEPNILILDEPTRGIDVLTKSEIHHLSSQLAQEGKAVLMISSEMPELIGMCDRIIVLHEGRITGELSRSEFDQQTIMNMAMGNV